jgi:hypothetical protein
MTRKNLQGDRCTGVARPPNWENGRVRTPKNKQNLVVSVGVGIGLAIVVMGLNSATTGREAQRIPDVIESINPGPGDEVLRQSQVFVDLMEGYNAVLVLDGIELPVTRLDEISQGANPRPGAQVDIPPTAIYDPGNFTISYLPQEGAPIEEFSQGVHTGKIWYWRITDDRSKAKSFSWEFSAN